MDKYKTAKIHADKFTRAKKLGLNIEGYITHLEALVNSGRTTEQENALSRMQSNEGATASLAEAVKHIRYMQDSQSKKIDDIIEITTKLINAFSADAAFIQALKKEITQ